jgi:hypothetical protein
MIDKRSPARQVRGSDVGPAVPGTAIHLRLYVASTTPNSQRAEVNLRVALQALAIGHSCRLEVIDVLEDGQRAVLDSVIVTPTLVALGLTRRFVMIGDLSDSGKLRGFLETVSNTG